MRSKKPRMRVFDSFKPGERVLIRMYGDVRIGTVIRYVGLAHDPRSQPQRVPMYAVRVIKGKTVSMPRVPADWMWRTTTQEIVNAWRAEVQGR